MPRRSRMSPMTVCRCTVWRRAIELLAADATPTSTCTLEAHYQSINPYIDYPSISILVPPELQSSRTRTVTLPDRYAHTTSRYRCTSYPQTFYSASNSVSLKMLELPPGCAFVGHVTRHLRWWKLNGSRRRTCCRGATKDLNLAGVSSMKSRRASVQ